MMKKLLFNFFKCGFLGWCLEITFTALHSLKNRNFSLMGQTSLWMFPIYGSACFLAPVFKLCKKSPALVRGSIYAVFIFVGEFISGSLLKARNVCPWSYSRSRWHIREVIRLDYFPNWLVAGLLFERLLTEKNEPSA